MYLIFTPFTYCCMICINLKVDFPFIIRINNFHHIPSSCIVNGTYGKRSSAHGQSSLYVCMLYRYTSITDMNSTDRLSTSIVDKNDRSMFQLCTYQCIAPPTPLRANVGNRWGFANIRGYCLTPGADYESETPPNPVYCIWGYVGICFTVATLTTVR